MEGCGTSHKDLVYYLVQYLLKRGVYMNEENLVSFAERSTEELREIARKGGINSGKSRRQRKTLKEELLLLLAEGDTQKSISVALIQQALDGNTKAFEVIRDSIGEKQADKIEAELNNEINIVIK